jgi:hypothetical protein
MDETRGSQQHHEPMGEAGQGPTTPMQGIDADD